MIFFLSLACASKNPVHTIGVGDQSVKVEVVATPETRAQGLMHRDSLGADRGMLFVYPEAKPRGFWMKNTRIPLSIAYADSDGVIVKIADMTPMSTERVPSIYPARYALEMNRGWFEANGVAKGAKLTKLPTDIEVK